MCTIQKKKEQKEKQKTSMHCRRPINVNYGDKCESYTTHNHLIISSAFLDYEGVRVLREVGPATGKQFGP